MSEADNAEAMDALRDAILHLNHADVWFSERAKLLRAISPYLSECPWLVDNALYRRRRVLSQEKALSWVTEKEAVRDRFHKGDFQWRSTHAAGVADLLEEYDGLMTSLGSGLRFRSNPLDDFTEDDKKALLRLGELRSLLNEQGVDVQAREDLIVVLTDFDFALQTVKMTNEPLDCVDCPLLEPVAEYLAKRQIHSSYLSRFFAMCLLNCLKLEAGAGSKASKILARLGDNFSNLGSPSTCDGRELKEQLREVRRLDIGVPSILFSLFQIILPGR